MGDGVALTQLVVRASCCECDWAEGEAPATGREQRRQSKAAEAHTETAAHATEVIMRPAE